MSETILKILIDELDRIRIVCEKCEAAIELPIDRLDSGGHIQEIACPAGCGKYRVPPSYRSDTLAKFADTLQTLKQTKGCRIEFVLPPTDKNGNL